jgi:glucosamine--fructose-6-phosphate aminotransferase (isomerizing)
MTLNNSFYISDILSQAEALRNVLREFNAKPLDDLKQALRSGRIDRVVMTGMGASYFALYPSWLKLVDSGFPAIWVDNAELLHYGQKMITEKTLLWLVSQSGRSAEIVTLLDNLKENQPGALLAVTNDMDSPLAKVVRGRNELAALLSINAEPEISVSTRTYVNTLAVCQLAASALSDEDISPIFRTLQKTADRMGDYLANWKEHLRVIGEQLQEPRHLALVGRGHSLAAVYCGATIVAEAAKVPMLAMPAGEFRHGPIEMCGPELTVMIFAGHPKTMELNLRLAQDMNEFKSRVLWLGPEKENLPVLPLPVVDQVALPLAEILPIQLASVYLAQQKGLEPGKFYRIGKVTLQE